MAARIDRVHSERVRARIRLSQLVTRLQNNALGRKGVVMSQQQIDSAKFLVGKALGNPPEIKELSGLEGGPIETSHTVEYVNVPHTVASET